MRNTEIHLVRRPVRLVREDDFASREAELPARQPDQLLVRVKWLSMDPYLNELTISDAMRPMVPLNTCMAGRGIGEVVEGPLPAGTLVAGEFGWRRHAVVAASGVAPLPGGGVPPTWYLSVLGTPGLTAWLGLNEVLKPLAGQTLLVSSAAGAVGSIVGQLARAAGLTVAGIAGGADKCAWLSELGFHAAIDRRQVEDWPQALRAVAPEGFDLYFDNAGGAMLEAALGALKPRGRAMLCGHSAEYHGQAARLAASVILYKRLTVQGFLVWDYAERFGAARAALAEAVAKGGLRMQETLYSGLDSAPRALGALMSGKGMGKHVVQVD